MDKKDVDKKDVDRAVEVGRRYLEIKQKEREVRLAQEKVDRMLKEREEWVKRKVKERK